MMPRYLSTRINGSLAIAVALATTALPVRTGFAQGVDQNLWVANGPVYAVARSGNTLFIGGAFTQVGPATGAAASIDASTGMPGAGFPKVAGTVRVVASDGAGGWFIGGTFTGVGGIPRASLAHVLADNSVASWNPSPNDGVYSMAVSGSLVYVGGRFTSVGGEARNRIAALDAGTGLATTWDPNAEGLGGVVPTSVDALAISGSTIYAGGYFNSIGGQSRYRLAALDATTGLATSWNPSPTYPSFPGPHVAALAVSGTTVYVGGQFQSIGGAPRSQIAALDAASGFATAFNANPVGTVSALAVSGGLVYVGGGFVSMGGQPRNDIAALDAVTGSATAWNPNASSAVYSLAVDGAIVYAGGIFKTIGGQPRNYLAALETAGTGSATAWNPDANQAVYALSVSGSTVLAGGAFSSVGGQVRNRLAALDATTGSLAAWNPNADGQVNALSVSGGTIFAAGNFTNAGGQARNYIAALDGGTGLATTWNPNANSSVNAIALGGSVVYAGGEFSSIGGQPRNRIAALNVAGTGVATGWNPNADNSVYALFTDGSTVYAGGNFTTIGGQPRNRIAALDVAGNGPATGWNPNASSTVLGLTKVGSTVYAGGNFTTIGGQTRNRIAAVDIAGIGPATDWNPNASSVVRAVAVSGSTVYAAGGFSTIGGQTRNGIAALDGISGLALTWNPDADANGEVNHSGWSLAISGATVYVAGNFSRVGLWPQSNIAAIAASPEASGIAPATAGNDGPVTVTIIGSGLPSNAAAKLARSGQTDVMGTDVTVAPDAASLTATFDITGALAGSWDVVVSTPDAQTATLPAGFTVQAVTGVGDTPLAFGLEKIRPNPSSGPVPIKFSLPTAARIRLDVYDLAGRELKSLVAGEWPAGRHTVAWTSAERDGPVAPGLYFVRLETPAGIWVQRFALIR